MSENQAKPDVNEVAENTATNNTTKKGANTKQAENKPASQAYEAKREMRQKLKDVLHENIKIGLNLFLGKSNNTEAEDLHAYLDAKNKISNWDQRQRKAKALAPTTSDAIEIMSFVSIVDSMEKHLLKKFTDALEKGHNSDNVRVEYETFKAQTKAIIELMIPIVDSACKANLVRDNIVLSSNAQRIKATKKAESKEQKKAEPKEMKPKVDETAEAAPVETDTLELVPVETELPAAEVKESTKATKATKEK